jgi:hypothetical protein
VGPRIRVFPIIIDKPPYADALPAAHVVNTAPNHVLGALFSFLFLLASFTTAYVAKKPFYLVILLIGQGHLGRCQFEFVCGLP